MTDWEKIRHEYITTDISLRKIAEKYKVSKNTVFCVSNKEKWAQERDSYRDKVRAEAQQKAIKATTEAEADIAATSSRITAKLLHRIEETIDKMPQATGTKSYMQEATKQKGKTNVKSIEYDLQSLCTAYGTITRIAEAHSISVGTNDDPLVQILKRWDNAAGIASQSETD